jgi:hypothetical protein
MDDDTQTSATEERRLQAAADAAERIKRGQHWLDWMYVAEGIGVGRAQAMRLTGTNQPVGRAYNQMFGRWLNEHKWARDLDKPTRAHLFWCLDHRTDIDSWRETLASNERARLNHPTAMKRRYEATHRSDATAREKPPETERDRLLREIERVTGEREAWRKRAETEGSLFDLKKDTVADIARTIAGNLSPHRLQSLSRALIDEIARRKAEQKQAG